METFFKRLAKLFIGIDSAIKNGVRSLFSALNSQFVVLFFTLVMISLTIIFVWAWMGSPIWVRILFLLIFLIVLLFSASAIYFYVKGVGDYGTRSSALENYSDFENIQVIIQNEVVQQRIFDAFSKTHIQGNFQSFLSLLNVQRIESEGQLIWIDTSPNNPKKINRQTLLEFLSQIFAGFENLSNKTIVAFCDYYFVLGDKGKDHTKVSSKNVSDWRINKSPYLLGVSKLVSKAIKG